MSAVKICASSRCGAKFVSDRSDKLYCSHKCCLYENRKSWSEKQKAERKIEREIREGIRPRNGGKKHKSIAEIDAEARKEGISYGKFIAKYGL